MLIFKSSFTYDNIKYPLEWHEVDSFNEVPYENATQVYGINFLNGKVVLITKDHKEFNLPGGSIEPGETYEQTIERETIEETNMKVVKSIPLGYQVVTMPNGKRDWQLRMVTKVEKIGEFVKDPGGNVLAYHLCDLEKINARINYGKVGERLILRSTALRRKL